MNKPTDRVTLLNEGESVTMTREEVDNLLRARGGNATLPGQIYVHVLRDTLLAAKELTGRIAGINDSMP